MQSVRKALVLFTAVCMLLTIAVSGAAAQEFTDVDWGEPAFESKTSDVTPLDNGTVNYDETNELLQFRFQSSSSDDFSLDSESVQIYIDSDLDETTGVNDTTYDSGGDTEDYFNNISDIGADYNIQVGNGEETLFEWVETSGSGFFTGRTGVTASQSSSEILVEVPIDQIDVEQGDEIGLKFAYTTDSDLGDGSYDWSSGSGESTIFTTEGADGESGTIAEHEINGTVSVAQDDGGLTLAPTDVTVSAVTDNGNEADEETVTINNKADSGDYSLTVDADNFEGGDGVVQAEFNATREDFRLNESQTPKETGNLNEGDATTENFTIEPAATVNGTVSVNDNTGLSDNAIVELSLAGQTTEVTLENEFDNKEYNLTVFEDELDGGATLTAAIANQEETETDLDLNKTEVTDIDLGVGDQREENFEIQPPQISVSVIPEENEPIDIRTNDTFNASVVLSNNLDVDVYSVSHTLDFAAVSDSITVTDRADIDASATNLSDAVIQNKSLTTDSELTVDITGNAPDNSTARIYNVTFNITKDYQGKVNPEDSLSYDADGDLVEELDIEQTDLKAVDENNETISNFQADAQSIEFTQTETLVNIEEESSLLKTKSNMVGSTLKVEATATSPNDGDLKNITLIDTDSNRELDNISCEGAECSTTEDNLRTYTPDSTEDTLNQTGQAKYGLTDKFKIEVNGDGSGADETDIYNLDSTPIYQRGDISSATGTPNGTVDITDLVRLSRQRGTETAELPWNENRITDNSIYDVNNDGIIDIVDMTIVAREGT